MVDPNNLDAHRRRGSLVVMPWMNLQRFGLNLSGDPNYSGGAE
ncbi:MAG TPA: hypothetical protein VKM56_10640 [Verrucomicrobiae bacterium]|nr:hypothetical protein [Verrucomicrobiae bacterium]